MRPDRTDPDRCGLCGREIQSSPSTNEDGTPFCSTGCCDVHSSFDAVDARTGESAPDRDGDRDEDGVSGRDDAIGGDGKRARPSGGDGDPNGEVVRTFLRIDGTYSATCESYLEAVAEGCDGVVDAEASYVTETIRVDHDSDRVSKADLRDALSGLGYTAYLREETTDDRRDSEGTTRRSREMAGMRKRRDDFFLEMRYAVGILFGAFLMIPYVAVLYPAYLASLLDWGVLDAFGQFRMEGRGGMLFLRLYFVLTGIVLLFTGLPVLRGAYIALKMRRPNTDLLVAITVTSAYVYGTVAVLLGRSDVFFDLTVVVAAAVTAATFYESSIKQRALDRLTDLTVSDVDSARLYERDGTTTEVPVEELAPGDRVLVRRGERIPVDGTLADGECTVDEAIVTGESLPVVKRPGDDLVGGSIVTSDAAVVRVGGDATSSIDRITTAVWELQSADHGVQRSADRMASRVVGPLFAAAAIAGAAAVLLGVGVPVGLLVFLTILLVGSPWAVGLATPLSVATSLEAALRRGIVVFDETVFERLRAVDVVVFDKTGTLTTGELDVIEADAPRDLLAAAAALEQRSSHPAAEAIATAFASEGSDDVARPDGGTIDGSDEGRTDGVSEFAGHATGVEGVVEGTEVLAGNLDLFADAGWTVSDAIERSAREARGFGRLPVVVGRDGAAEGIVVLGDEPRDGWDEAMTRLGERGIEIVVLTGDDEEATDFFGRHEHVSYVFAGVPPEGKTATIRRLGADRRVAMVGDGTNDAPALAAADLGISLGSGTALAADAADVAIADDDVGTVEMAFDVAGAARRRIRQNNALALLYNAIAIPAAVTGVLNPLTAAVAVGVTGALVAVNSSRELIDR